MPSKPSKFGDYPGMPKSQFCQKGYYILCNAHKSASSFRETLIEKRLRRGARGATTDDEQDLLRAALLFACAGIDSLIKQLISDTVTLFIENNEGARQSLREFVRVRIDTEGSSFLSEAIMEGDSYQFLVERYKKHLLQGSLQSLNEILKTAAVFDVILKPKDLGENNAEMLRQAFNVRNQIVHEMDVNFDHTNRSRNPRAMNHMDEYTNAVFSAAAIFLQKIDSAVFSFKQ
jgi:hypothetical protein